MINLQGRLLLAASMLEGCERPADIGTDHAYIPIYLVQSGKYPKVIATDVKKGPLLKAAKNIDKYQLSDRIELRLGDGIKPIGEGECDAFIIAGMGGVVISEILEASLETVKKARVLVLQPVYTDAVLREYLFQKGFRIDTEVLVRDEGRIYVVIRAFHDGLIRQDESLYYHIGRALFEQQDPLLKVYLERRIRIQAKIVHGLEKAQQPDKRVYLKEYELLAQMKAAFMSLDMKTV